VTRESAGNPFQRISGARAFSHVQRLSLDPAEPRPADSPLAGQHQSYKSNSCITQEYSYLMRVVPSRISNIERKRGQYQDYGFVRAKRNVASKRRYLRNVEKSPVQAADL